MSSTLHFPNEQTIFNSLISQETLSREYYQENGLTTAIARCAAKRFANKKNSENAFQTEIDLIINDLKCGKDGCTDEVLPFVYLPQSSWKELAKAIDLALHECVIKQNKN